MNIKELYEMAKAANRRAKVAIEVQEDGFVIVRWYGMPPDSGLTELSRAIPWSALDDDRAPYRAVREYLKMSAFYMEGMGGVPDKTHELFSTLAPPEPDTQTVERQKVNRRLEGMGLRQPVVGLRRAPPDTPAVDREEAKRRLEEAGLRPTMSLTSSDLLPGDVVLATGRYRDKTVDTVEPVGCDYRVYWRAGGSTRYSHAHIHLVVRRGQDRE